MSLRQIAIGSLSMSSVTMLRMTLQVFILPILARYLSPDDYGLVALTMPFVLFAMEIADGGLSTSLIRERKINKSEWSTCYWLISGIGILFSVGVIIIGYLMSILLEKKEIFLIFSAMSIIIPLQTLSTVPSANIQREHRFPLLATIEIIAMVSSLAVVITSAMNGLGAWSLVLQQITHYSIKLILTIITGGFLPNLTFNIKLITEHLHFGKNILGSSLVNFLKDTGTKTLYGKFLGVTSLGYITMAELVINIPKQSVSGPLHAVLYPLFAKIKDDRSILKIHFLNFSQLLGFIIIPLFGILAIASDSVFNLFLSEKWANSAIIFSILAPFAALETVSSLKGTIVKAVGETQIILKQAIELATLILLTVAITMHYGLFICLISVSAISVLYVLRSLMMILPIINTSLIEFFKIHISSLTITIVAIITYHLTKSQLDLEITAQFITALCIGIMSLITNALINRKKIKEIIKTINELNTHIAKQE